VVTWLSKVLSKSDVMSGSDLHLQEQMAKVFEGFGSPPDLMLASRETTDGVEYFLTLPGQSEIRWRPELAPAVWVSGRRD
jgi:hypothetical protein